MKVKEWCDENLDFRREENEVRDNKGYCYTLAAVGLMGGVATGVLAVILQIILGDASFLQTVLDIVAYAIVAALLAYLIWLLLPMFKDPQIAVSAKVKTSLLSLACIAVPFIIGMYLILIAVIALIVLVAFWFAGKMWGVSEKANSKQGDLIDTMMGMATGMGGNNSSKDNDKYDTIMSEDGMLYGDRVDHDTFRANGTTYKRCYDGVVEVWRPED